MSVPLRAGDTVIYVEDREGLLWDFWDLISPNMFPLIPKLSPNRYFVA